MSKIVSGRSLVFVSRPLAAIGSHLRPRSGTKPGNRPGVAVYTNAHEKQRNPLPGAA